MMVPTVHIETGIAQMFLPRTFPMMARSDAKFGFGIDVQAVAQHNNRAIFITIGSRPMVGRNF
jgi:hypothetical protein